MKMKGQYLILSLVLIALMVLPMCLAEDMTVKIKTMKEYNLSVRFTVTDVLSGVTTSIFDNSSENKEEIIFNFACPSSLVRLYASLGIGNSIIKISRYENYSCGGIGILDPLNLENITKASASSSAITGNVVAENLSNNASNTNSAATINNSNSTNTGGSSSGLFLKLNIPWKKIFSWAGYIIGGIIVVFVVVLIIKFIVGKIRGGFGFSSEFFRKKSEDIVIDPKTERDLIQAEKKIKEAQETIDFIKNKKNKVAEAERKFQEAKKELEKIKGY